MRTKELSPSRKAMTAARKLASKRDSWMTPTGECSDEWRTDYGVYFQEEREGWEETDHFSILYRQPMERIGWDDAYAQGFDETQHSEPTLTFLYDFYLPLADEFWERWAQVHKLYEFWQKLSK